MRTLYPAALAVLAFALSGCLSDSDDPTSTPNPPTTGVPDLPTADATFVAQFDPLIGIVPYPNDILGFLADPDTDGTLNVPELATWPLASQINKLDGFSTFGRITVNFTRSLSPDSIDPAVNPLNAFAVVVIEVQQDPATKAVVGVAGLPLQRGVDYTVSVADDVDADGKVLEINPLKPLNPKSGYLVIVTDRVADTQGNPASAAATYAQIKAGYQAGVIVLPPPGTPIPPDLTDEQLLAIFIATHLAVVEGLAEAGLPISVDDVVVSASFSTQSITDALESVDASATAQPSQIQQAVAPADLPLPDGSVLPAGTPITTGIVLGLQGVDSQCPPTVAVPLPGCGFVFAGGMNLPYYLEPPADQNDPTAVTSIWEGTPGLNPADPDSITLSRYNPVPNKKADILVPVIMAVPGPNSQYVQG